MSAKRMDIVPREKTKLRILKTITMKPEASALIQSLMAASAVEITSEINSKNAIARINPNEKSLALRKSKIPF